MALFRKYPKRNSTGGFLGAAKTFDKAPYREVPRSPEMFLYGENSSFITPKTKEEQDKCPRGIKR